MIRRLAFCQRGDGVASRALDSLPAQVTLSLSFTANTKTKTRDFKQRFALKWRSACVIPFAFLLYLQFLTANPVEAAYFRYGVAFWTIMNRIRYTASYTFPLPRCSVWLQRILGKIRVLKQLLFSFNFHCKSSWLVTGIRIFIFLKFS